MRGSGNGCEPSPGALRSRLPMLQSIPCIGPPKQFVEQHKTMVTFINLLQHLFSPGVLCQNDWCPSLNESGRLIEVKIPSNTGQTIEEAGTEIRHEPIYGGRYRFQGRGFTAIFDPVKIQIFPFSISSRSSPHLSLRMVKSRSTNLPSVKT